MSTLLDSLHMTGMSTLAGIVDSHCHLDPKYVSRGLPSPDVLLQRGRDAGLVGFVVVGVGEDTAEAQQAVSLSQKHGDVTAVVGVHPHDASAATDTIISHISELAALPTVSAVGEIGLDFHYDHSPRDVQRTVFRRFVELAKELHKPIVIHTRSAGEEALAILEELGAKTVGGVIHCFSEDMAFARRALDLGFYLSFSGIVTFKTATKIQEVARFVPSDRLFVETDAPYLAPIPFRGKPCEPAMVVHTVRYLAQLRGERPEDMALQSAQNTRRLFPALAHF